MRIAGTIKGITFAVALALPGLSLGWGGDGHEIIGYIAADLITDPVVKKKIKKLLHDDETLATAAKWADCAKGYRYCHVAPTPEMVDFADRNPQHHNYHYTDIPFQLTSYSNTAPGASPDDVVHILEDAIRKLKDPSLTPPHDISEREAFLIILHMVGDIHQPLHVGAAYIDSDDTFTVPSTPEEEKATFTKGGNLMCRGSKVLHSYWDSDLVLKAMKAEHVLTNEEYATKLLPLAKKTKVDQGVATGWPKKWATETLRVSKLELATLTVIDDRAPGKKSDCSHSQETKEGVVWDVEFPDDYAADGATTAKEQLAKAGARLAYVLKAALK